MMKRDPETGRTLKQHGMIHQPEYHAWHMAKQRCINPNVNNWRRYGGRGISMCPRWLYSFQEFFSDMGPRPSPDHSLERRNNDGPYSPMNCIWGTKEQQCRNMSTNSYVYLNGEKLTVAEAVRKTGIPEMTIRSRIKRGEDRSKVLIQVDKATKYSRRPR